MPSIKIQAEGPHAGIRALVGGNNNDPTKALLLFHGRGGSAHNMMHFSDRLDIPGDTVVFIPEATGNVWYPQRFIRPLAENEPHLSSALDVVETLLKYCADDYRISHEHVYLAGFSQGACLIAEYIVRHPKKYAGACIFSGGLIGEDNEVGSHAGRGDLTGVSLYMGCDEDDPHIPAARFEASAAVFRQKHATLTAKLYKGLGHTVHPEGIAFLNKLLAHQ